MLNSISYLAFYDVEAKKLRDGFFESTFLDIFIFQQLRFQQNAAWIKGFRKFQLS